jgi:hypothetical protein
MRSRPSDCPNLNHRTTNVVVRFCTMCGKVVNQNVPKRKCTEAKHAVERRRQNRYCAHCGGQLIR